MLLPFVCALGCSKPQQKNQLTWQVNSLENIGGYTPTVIGDPKVIKADGKQAVEFDGVDDGLQLDVNPIAGAEEFTIEVTFKPYAGGPENFEQRFLHIEDPADQNRRILIELRLNRQQRWYADFHIRTPTERITLIDSTRTHPVNEWHQIKLVYKNGKARGFVNGVAELSDQVQYSPMGSTAKTSLGTRMDKRSWFKGAISKVTFSPVTEE